MRGADIDAVSLPPALLLRVLSVLGRRAGVVGISGSEAMIRASRDRRPHPVAAAVARAVNGAASRRLRRTETRTESGVQLVVHTPAVTPGTVLPVVVYLHGGGWVLGGVEDTPWWVGGLAETLPAVVVSVDYRLAPEHPYPAAIEDCLEAVRWVARHPHHIGAQARVATSQLGLVGDSAGGNLVAAVTLRLRDEPAPGDPRIDHQVLIYPALDATFASPSASSNARAPMLTRADMERFLQLYTAGTGVQPTEAWLSPLSADSFAGLPPTTVLTAEHDPLRDDGSRYAARLREAAVPVRLSHYPGAVHGFIGLAGVDRVRTRQALAEIVTAFRHDLLGSTV